MTTKQIEAYIESKANALGITHSADKFAFKYGMAIDLLHEALVSMEEYQIIEAFGAHEREAIRIGAIK